MLTSLLAIRDLPAAAPSARAGTVVALHGYGGDLDQLAPLCRAVAPTMRLVLAEGPKTVMAYTVQTAENFAGYSWYPGDLDRVDELVRFGHALACLEELIADIAGEQGPEAPIVLIGHDQGAVMALTLAAILPDVLAGVAAIRGGAPATEGWEPPFQPMDGLPVLLVDSGPHPVAVLDAFERRGARLSLRQAPVTQANPSAAAPQVATWLEGLQREV
jgi:predicted esterase